MPLDLFFLPSTINTVQLSQGSCFRNWTLWNNGGHVARPKRKERNIAHQLIAMGNTLESTGNHAWVLRLWRFLCTGTSFTLSVHRRKTCEPPTGAYKLIYVLGSARLIKHRLTYAVERDLPWRQRFSSPLALVLLSRREPGRQRVVKR
jgi:hypothetical protein